ncbi:hypothetical protein L2E82_39892 [Cichorium intybus]|uniref:Uncharacterized protein n=1 Tax=Cichorium intybus TaxID=13427 RepID=A0ACB9AL68_CICIN|nr:hypothetical protein L2E82_39892 [Cichorium intybus]
MGCVKSSNNNDGRRRPIRIRKPRPWDHTEAITRAQLNAMREEFWDTAPYYGGQREIWDALRAAAEAELHLAQAIIDSAGIIAHERDLTVCYDERGKLDCLLYLTVLDKLSRSISNNNDEEGIYVFFH